MMGVLRGLKIRRRTGERGQALAEFALTFMIVMLVIFWTWELVMVVYTYTVMSAAAKVGARYAIVHGPDLTTGGTSTCDGMQTLLTPVVRGYAKYSLHDISALVVTVSCPAGVTPPAQVTVTITYAYV